MANIHIKPDVESTQPKPYLQSRRGHGMPCSFMWNVQGDKKKYAEGYKRFFGDKDELPKGKGKTTYKWIDGKVREVK